MEPYGTLPFVPKKLTHRSLRRDDFDTFAPPQCKRREFIAKPDPLLSVIEVCDGTVPKAASCDVAFDVFFPKYSS